MPPTTKRPAKPPAKKSGQQDIRVLVENVQKASSFKKPLPPSKQAEPKPSTSKAKNPATEPIPSTSKAGNHMPEQKPSTSKARTSAPEPAPGTSKTVTPQLSLADRSPYALEIFLAKTNVRDLAREAVLAKKKSPSDLTSSINSYCRKLYKCYANESKMRLWPPLHKLVFASPYYEYRFYLALNQSMQTQEQYDDYRDQLNDAGLKECWVAMRKNNVVMLDQDKVVALLQERFSHCWAGKLRKLDKYVMDYQRHREQLAKEKRDAEVLKTASSSPVGDPEVLVALLHHSNCTLGERRIRNRYRHINPESMAADLVWTYGPKLTFDSDELNRRFGLGAYRIDKPSPEEQLVPAAPSPVEQPPTTNSTDVSSNESDMGSVCSEIRYMRSNMAMTQPQEFPFLDRAVFSTTQELVTALEEPPTIAPVAPSLEEELVAQQPAYDADFLKNCTNLVNVLKRKIESRYEDESKRAKLFKNIDSSIRKFAKQHADLLAQRKLPPGVQILSTAPSAAKPKPVPTPMEIDPPAKPAPVPKPIDTVSEPRSTVPSAVEPEPQPKPGPAPKQRNSKQVKCRPIQYHESPEDNSQMDTGPPPRGRQDDDRSVVASLPMDTEDFHPNECSTQVDHPVSTPQYVGTPIVRIAPRSTRRLTWPEQVADTSAAETVVEHLVTQRTPVRPSPSKAATSHRSDVRASVDSANTTSESPNTTVLEKPRQPAVVKYEPDTSGYEGHVEVIVIDEDPIIDLTDEPASYGEIDPIQLIAQQAALGEQESNARVMPSPMQKRVDSLALFRLPDTTLSQSSSSSGEPEVLSQKTQPSALGFP